MRSQTQADQSSGLFAFLPSLHDPATASLGSCPSGMKQAQQPQCSSWRLSAACGAEKDFMAQNCSTSDDGNQSFGLNA